MYPFLLILFSAALAAGLTIGLVSLNQNELILLTINGTESEKSYAKRVLPLLEDYHTLIVSLV
jgi:metal transporter CNNM